MNTVRMSRRITGIVQRYVAVAWFGVAAMVLCVPQIGGVATAQQAASMVITGPVTTPVDSVVSIAIYVKTTTPVNAVQADVKFPTDLLAYQSVNNAGSAFDADLISNAANGNLSLVRIKIDGGAGDMLVSTVNFKALKNGKAELQLLDSSMATDAQTSENIVTVRQGLTIQVGDPALNASGGGSTGGKDTPTEDLNGDGIVDVRDTEITVTPTPADGDVTGTAEPTPLGGEDAPSGISSAAEGTISTVTWALAGGSVLLIIASVFFSLRLLHRRSRRLAAYAPYGQSAQTTYGADVYGYGTAQYPLPQQGYTTAPQSYQAQPGQVPSPAGQYPYPGQVPQNQAAPQAGTYPPVNQAYPPAPQPPAQTNGQYPW